MPPDPLASPNLLPLVPAFIALFLRSFAIAADAAAGAVGNERAEELEKSSGAGRALARLKAQSEMSVASVRMFVALCLALATALMAWAGVSLAAAHAPAVSPVMAALAGALVAWLFTTITDVIPRSLAALHPEPWALSSARFLLLVRALFAPLTHLVAAVGDLALRPFGARVRFGLPPPPLDEIERLLANSAHEGAPEPALVRSLFEFGDRTVKEIMVPRTDLHAIPSDADVDELIRIFVEEGHTRVPVYKGTLDSIIGIVHVKDLLPLLANPELIILHDLLRPTIFVPWNRPIQKVMRELQRKRQHFAVVVDEYGGVAGVVTLEDIVEQIVGQIRDEFDEDEVEVTSAADGASLVRGEMRIDDFNDTFHAEVPTEDGYETLAGFLNALAGAIPAEGDRFYHGGFEFLVTRRDPRRVLEVKVTRTRAGGEVPPVESRV